MSLQKFLNANPVDNITGDVPVSNRFKDEKGKLLKFKIKGLLDTEFEEYRKNAMKISADGEVDVDNRLLQSRIVINNTLDPNFKDAESIKAMGVTTPEQYLSRVLLAGEIATLAQEIQKLSGFNQKFKDVVDEAKN